jgi:hypothetical protein
MPVPPPQTITSITAPCQQHHHNSKVTIQRIETPGLQLRYRSAIIGEEAVEHKLVKGRN